MLSTAEYLLDLESLFHQYGFWHRISMYKHKENLILLNNIDEMISLDLTFLLT